jgi:multidrug resistance efflux pump
LVDKPGYSQRMTQPQPTDIQTGLRDDMDRLAEIVWTLHTMGRSPEELIDQLRPVMDAIAKARVAAETAKLRAVIAGTLDPLERLSARDAIRAEMIVQLLAEVEQAEARAVARAQQELRDAADDQDASTNHVCDSPQWLRDRADAMGKP